MVAPRLRAALLACPLALAGCIGVSGDEDVSPTADPRPARSLDALTQAIYDTVLREEASIAGADETRIWLDVYRPEVPDGVKVPVILVMTPYQSIGDAINAPSALMGDCLGPMPQDCPYDADLVDFFVPRGYAVAFSDVRGNHNSGGCIDQTGPKQWQDGYNTVEWLGTQGWSNGKVGMIGVSYDGETQTTTALTQPPHLATIVPIASVAGQYDYVYFQGVPYELQGLGTMGGYLAFSLLPGQDPQALPHYPERLACQPDNFAAGADLSGDMTPYWIEREYRLLAGQMVTPALHIHGLADWNVKPSNIDGWYNEWTNAPEKRAIYGQWNHNWPQRADWWDQGGILHRWFDHFLMDIDTGILQDLPPVLVQTDPGTCEGPNDWPCMSDGGSWRGIDGFPPLSQDWLGLHLNADLTISGIAGEAGEATLHDYPRDQFALPFPVEQVDEAIAGAGEALIGHPTKLVFESEPLTTDVHLTGVPYLTFTATTSETSTHWAALLEVVDGETAHWQNRGYQDTRHLAGLDAPADVTPGEPYNVTLKMFPQDDLVPAGSVLRLTLQNQDEWVHQDTTFAMSTVLLGDGGAVLHLPLAPAGQAYPSDALVAWGPSGQV